MISETTEVKSSPAARGRMMLNMCMSNKPRAVTGVRVRGGLFLSMASTSIGSTGTQKDSKVI